MNVYTVGEIVLDIIIESVDNVSIKVGGSMLNTSVTLGRAGFPVSHISYMADDKLSGIIFDFLMSNGVNTEYLTRVRSIKTNLALAMLDENRNADYTFYKEEITQSISLTYPDVVKDDIILFGSFFSLNSVFREQLVSFLKASADKGAFIIYDPNFRKTHIDKLDEYLPYIEENFILADMVKGSDEDFNLIYGYDQEEIVFNKLKEFGVDHLLYTKGEEGASYFSESFSLKAKAEDVKVMSTVGAGDTFTAGIIYSILTNRGSSFSEKFIEYLLQTSATFSAEVCKSMDNYLSVDFIKKFKNVQ